MIIVLSPSKTQDYSDDLSWSRATKPQFTTETLKLVHELKKLSANQLSKLMSVSAKLADLNHSRYQEFSSSFTKKNSRQALLAFRGDVYSGFDLESYSQGDIEFAQKHLRIISGLYGLLRPLDLIQPYRLEMKTPLSSPEGKDLYHFWADKLSKQIEKEKPKQVINLASHEYFKAIEPGLSCDILTPVFKQKKGNDYKVIALFAKQARGSMANYIIKNRITSEEKLEQFRELGYRFNAKLSDQNTLTFTRSTT